jgi:hypothetical protein
MKREYFEDILNKEGVELTVVMDGLETRLNAVIEQIESWGGVRPKTDNSTTDYDKFTMTMESDYKNMLQQIKVLVAKVRNMPTYIYTLGFTLTYLRLIRLD